MNYAMFQNADGEIVCIVSDKVCGVIRDIQGLVGIETVDGKTHFINNAEPSEVMATLGIKPVGAMVTEAPPDLTIEPGERS